MFSSQRINLLMIHQGRCLRIALHLSCLQVYMVHMMCQLKNSKASFEQKLSVHKFSDTRKRKPCLQVCLNNNFQDQHIIIALC